MIGKLYSQSIHIVRSWAKCKKYISWELISKKFVIFGMLKVFKETVWWTQAYALAVLKIVLPPFPPGVYLLTINYF